LKTYLDEHETARISEALALEVKDVDFNVGTITIQHLKSRVKLTCPECSARLGKSHTFCPKCGTRIEKAVAKAQERHRMRTGYLKNILSVVER